MKKITDTIAIVGPARFSYMNVFKPRINKKSGKEEYGVTLLIPKKANEFCPNPESILKELRELINAALVKKFKEVPKKYANPLKDGDVETNDDGDLKHPGYWFISTKEFADNPPAVIDSRNKPVLDATSWVSGDWGFAKVSFSAYDFDGTKGVSGYLKAVQCTKKDEPFGSGTTDHASDFDVVEEDFLA